jgi:hypothetical protein
MSNNQKQAKKQSKPIINHKKNKVNIKSTKKTYGAQRYRAIWQDYHHLKLPINWQIHHIDFNHKNNDIRNLLALPKSLHIQYHKLQLILHNITLKDDLSVLLQKLDFNFDTEILDHYRLYIEQILPDFEYLLKIQFKMTNQTLLMMSKRYETT